MNAQGNIIVWGSLLAVIVMIVAGAFVGGPWGQASLVLGVLGLVAWVIGALWIASAMNTDI